MKKYQIKTVMVTKIHMEREKVIAKEEIEFLLNGKEQGQDTVNDDLGSLFEDLQIGKEPNRSVGTYFFPKLTEKERELWERRDKNYIKLFSNLWENNPLPCGIFQEVVMQLQQLSDISESDSRFVLGQGYRTTFLMENESSPNAQNCCSLQ